MSLCAHMAARRPSHCALRRLWRHEVSSTNGADIGQTQFGRVCSGLSHKKLGPAFLLWCCSASCTATSLLSFAVDDIGVMKIINNRRKFNTLKQRTEFILVNLGCGCHKIRKRNEKNQQASRRLIEQK